MKKYILVFSAVLFLTPFFALAQTSLPNAGLTPESSFYFLDRLGEALQEFFTFNPEAKAHLQITFAAERVAEIKVILETKGVDAKGLEVAQSRLQSHLADAATIVTDQKSKGKDVSQLAKELDDEFEAPKTALEQTFKDEERALEVKEKELKAKIRAARQAGDSTQVEVLIKELGDVKAQKELLDLKKDDQEKALEKENEQIEKEVKAKAKAEKKIRKAEREKQELLDEAADKGITIPAEAFGAFNNHLTLAKAALAAGKFEEAKEHAEEAKESLEDVDKALERLEKAKEHEEELKDEEEDKLNKAEKKQEKSQKEEAKREAENLRKEQKRAREEIKKSEDKLREAGKMKEEENLKEERKKGEEETKKAEEQFRKESEKLNKEQNKAKEERTESSQTETAVVAPKTWTVEYKENQFVPSEVKIKKGDTVMWVNRSDSLMWPASAFHPTHQVYPGFDALKSLGVGENYSFKFDRVGSWKYHNHVNSGVTGVVEVE